MGGGFHFHVTTVFLLYLLPLPLIFYGTSSSFLGFRFGPGRLFFSYPPLLSFPVLILLTLLIFKRLPTQ